MNLRRQRRSFMSVLGNLLGTNAKESKMTTSDTNPVTTGWDNGLMQDYDKGLSRALSEKLDAREVVRNVFPAPSTLINGLTEAETDESMSVRGLSQKAAPSTSQPPDAEKELRRMLCVFHAGSSAYMDDGEAQDNRTTPCIDFLRDSPAEIRDKMRQIALRAEPSTSPTPPGNLWNS